MKKLLRLFLQNRAGVCLFCVLLQAAGLHAQNIDFGKSYVNITKGNGGGTVETGDTLEIRASFVVRSGTYDSCAFFDTIPAGTAYIAGTVRVLTNEGKIYKQFTDAAGDDEGWIDNGQQVRINLGYNQASAPATASRRGRVAATHRPSIYGYTCIMIASYRVRVTTGLNSYIYTGGGTCTYKQSNRPIGVHHFPANRVFVYTNYGICSNSVGANALGTEFNGTFGNGKARNRGASPNVPGYTYATFTSGSPADYYYGIANNTSVNTAYTTSNAWPVPDAHRVFNLWDIIGDHTGTADPYTGNAAADTVTNNAGGYMLVINAAYRIDSAFQQTISNLCPNTYYEISVWMRNICSRCGCDSTGTQASSAGYLPTAPGDSSGVYPNLTFEIDGTDYYTTGNLLYTGKWVKKGFVFRTGPTQTSFTLKLFNNAPGGGGNDWALDDISVATCSPDLTFTPQNDPLFCNNNVVTMGSSVRSFFDNYTEYKWQRSVNNGTSWADLPVAGSATPAQNGGAWEYHIAYPPFVGTMTDSGHKYRMIVATTTANLASTGCAFYGNTSVLTLHIDKCALLASHFLSFTGVQHNEHNQLQWTISSDERPVQFMVEKRDNGSFGTVATIPFGESNSFSWQEPAGSKTTFYRVVMVLADGGRVSSGIITLSGAPVRRLLLTAANPFQQQLSATLSVQQGGAVHLLLQDRSGRVVWKQKQHLESGRHQLQAQIPYLPDGVYLLSAISAAGAVHTKLLKQTAP